MITSPRHRLWWCFWCFIIFLGVRREFWFESASRLVRRLGCQRSHLSVCLFPRPGNFLTPTSRLSRSTYCTVSYFASTLLNPPYAPTLQYPHPGTCSSSSCFFEALPSPLGIFSLLDLSLSLYQPCLLAPARPAFSNTTTYLSVLPHDSLPLLTQLSVPSYTGLRSHQTEPLYLSIQTTRLGLHPN